MKKQKEISDLLLLCIKANESKDYSVFFDYSGHVDKISFRINKPYNYPIFNDYIYIKDELYNETKFKETIEVWRKELTKIINKNN